MRTVEEWIDELHGRGGYSPDVIWDDTWTTVSADRLWQLIHDVQQEAYAEGYENGEVICIESY